MSVINWIKQHPLLSLAFVLSIILNFYRIDYQSAWLDELHSLNEANPSFTFSEVYANLAKSEQMPPLYFYLLHFVFKIFGYTVIAGRFLSAITAIICIYAMYLLGKSLFNKQEGQLAALFLSVNQFHIYYAQEMRPYILFELFTILSFYRLILFLKNPNFKNSILYGIFAGILLYAHFFGMFTIVAQCCILLFFLIIRQKEQRKAFFLKTLLAGVIILLLFIPLVPTLLRLLEIKVFWIPDPKPDIIYLIFREFFGRSLELLLFVVVIAVFFYRKSYKEFKVSLSYDKLLENRFAFSFIILTGWLIIVILLPLIKSYLSTSIMLDRYFIGLMPNLILLFTIGLITISEKKRKYLIVIFVLYSLVNIVIIKKYYFRIHKTQFREITGYIKNNNQSNAPVISSLSWYYTYFFKEEKSMQPIAEKTLEDYINEMQQDSTKIKEFWYTDAHNREYTLSLEGQEFLYNNFVAQDIVSFYDCWTRHYIPKTDKNITADATKWNDFKTFNSNDIEYKIESTEIEDGVISVNGYAYIKHIENVATRLSAVLLKNGEALKMPTEKITTNRNLGKITKPDYLYGTFKATKSLMEIEAGDYTIGICIENKEHKKHAFILTDEKIRKEE